MKNLFKLTALTALAVASPLSAQDAEKPKMLSPGQIVEKAPASDWIAIAPSRLLIMDLEPDATGKARRTIIQLKPDWFNRDHLANIRKLATAHWWDGTSINRVQDNYVVQWGDASAKKPLPEDLVTVSEGVYEYEEDDLQIGREALEKERPVTKILRRDAYAPYTDFEEGWPFCGGFEKSYLADPLLWRGGRRPRSFPGCGKRGRALYRHRACTAASGSQYCVGGACD